VFYRDPADLSPRAVEVLKWMAEHKDGQDDYNDGYLTVSGLECWFGLNRTNRGVLNQLLECVFVSDQSGVGESSKLYAINGSGERWLKGEKPYQDSDGRLFNTMFELEAAHRRRK
jgi:hypothetical protein